MTKPFKARMVIKNFTTSQIMELLLDHVMAQQPGLPNVVNVSAQSSIRWHTKKDGKDEALVIENYRLEVLVEPSKRGK